MRRDLKLHVIGLMGRLGSEAFDFKKANAEIQRLPEAVRWSEGLGMHAAQRQDAAHW